MSDNRSLFLIFFKGFNLILFLGVISFAVYAGWLGYRSSDEAILTGSDLNAVNSIGINSIKDPLSNHENYKEFVYYEDQLRENDIFTVDWSDEPGETFHAVEQTTALELKSTIRVLGIVIDQQPLVVVENLKSRETSFLSVGDQIEQATLNGIFPDRVVFMQEGNEIIFETE